MRMYDFEESVWLYSSPFILILGLVGNIVTMVVIRRKCFRGTTTQIYMTFLAIFDAIALAFGIVPEWSRALDMFEPETLGEVHPVACKFEKMIFYVSSDTAIWLLVLLTLDRYFAVCHPMANKAMSDPTKATAASLITILACILKNLHIFWTRGARHDAYTGLLLSNCDKPEPYRNFEINIRPWIAFALITVLPFIMILVCNVNIIYTLAYTARGKSILRREKNMTSALSALVVVRKSKAAQAAYAPIRQTTCMCLGVSFFFLLCTAPSIILLIGKPYWAPFGRNEIYENAKAFNNLLSYFNHSVNVLLYCLTGQRFRRELKTIVLNCCTKCTKKESNTSYNISPAASSSATQNSSRLKNYAARAKNTGHV